MPRRKDRLPVVLDTNVIISYYLGKKPQSANAQIFRLWRYERKLQLIVSREVTDEYYELLERIGIAEHRVARFRQQLQEADIVTRINLGARHAISRDPDDDMLLATATAGQAQFLITNDHDLLDISTAQKKRFKFEIVTPAAFLMRWEA
ncbi:MAG TPA: putative toxin-antitoxin system toxin component, PIN family [Blastocatellia bacterium]|nr:putative toxin-antitoxin system toxin component, PIN family [Blastocatellia bacterium]